MKRLALGLLFAIGTAGGRSDAHAQSSQNTQEGAPAADAKGDDPINELTRNPAGTSGETVHKTGWEDIVVVPRKPFLKAGRVELNPFTGVSLNDVLIRHYSLGGEFNYFLTDVLSIGVQGQYYIKERTDREGIVGLQYNRVATLNRYKYAAALNFGYVPGYGKFTMFNRYIVHWEALVSAGVGVVRSEIIPRVVGDATWTNDRIAPNFGAGTRLFLNRWLTFNVMLRDYVFTDRFEPTDRKRGEDVQAVKDRAESRFVHNVMLYAGLGLYLPPTFQYRTPR